MLEDGEIQIDGYLLNHDYDEQVEIDNDDNDNPDDIYGIFGKQD